MRNKVLVMSFLMASTHLGLAQPNSDQLIYDYEKIQLEGSDYVKLDIRLPKSKIDTPIGILLRLKPSEPQAETRSLSMGRGIISGAKYDGTGRLSMSKTEFIFRIDSIPSGDYMVEFSVFQENGEMLSVNKKEKL